jgi:hypothetical protein
MSAGRHVLYTHAAPRYVLRKQLLDSERGEREWVQLALPVSLEPAVVCNVLPLHAYLPDPEVE